MVSSSVVILAFCQLGLAKCICIALSLSGLRGCQLLRGTKYVGLLHKYLLLKRLTISAFTMRHCSSPAHVSDYSVTGVVIWEATYCWSHQAYIRVIFRIFQSFWMKILKSRSGSTMLIVYKKMGQRTYVVFSKLITSNWMYFVMLPGMYCLSTKCICHFSAICYNAGNEATNVYSGNISVVAGTLHTVCRGFACLIDLFQWAYTFNHSSAIHDHSE